MLDSVEAYAPSFIKSHLKSARGSTINGMTEREVSIMTAVIESTNVYFNYTGQYPCTNLSDWEGTGDLDGYGWNILACNQLAMPIGMSEASMFKPFDFDYAGYTAQC